jgi:hypothetical protein
MAYFHQNSVFILGRERRSALSCRFGNIVEPKMLALEIIGCWVALSCAAGPLFAWAFFYPMRREDEIRRRGRSSSSSFQYSSSLHQLVLSVN